MTGKEESNTAWRPEWDAYFLAMALLASMRSTCIRRRVGAVIVLNRRILATGYNGAPAKTRHCMDIGCLRKELGIKSGERHEMCRGSHAEMNGIAQAASSGSAIAGSTVYTTHEPCSICSKLMINSGCVRVVYMHPYPDELSRTLRKEAGFQSDIYEDSDGVMKILRDTAAC
ncbi:MAG: dCMP deaminase family protein [Synergistaceae bacterium]|jgi:dCMP deaminase|nr:dCMP deaminase family protein [Synergistaceae bacterium]